MVKNIVILHGWASHLGNWQPFVNKLQKKGYKVYLPNLPTDKPMNTDEYSSWLKTYTKKLTKFILIGHSFGGQIAINHAARFPKKVVKLVLINSAGIRKKISLKRFIFLLLAKIGKLIFKLPLLSKYTSVAQKLLYKSAREQDYLKASTVLKKTLTIIVKENQKKLLANISIPTLLLWGQKDTATPLKDGKIMAKLISNSKLIVFKDARHALPFTHTNKLVDKIQWFIS